MQRIDVVAAVVIQADNLDGVTVFRLSGSDSSQELLSARGNPNSGNTVGTQWEQWVPQHSQHNTPKPGCRTHNLIHEARDPKSDTKLESEQLFAICRRLVCTTFGKTADGAKNHLSK